MRIMSRLPVLLAIALVGPAAAQIGSQVQSASGEAAIPSAAKVELFDTEAAAIIQYDDGEVDASLRGAATTETFELAMRFDGIGGTDVTLGGTTSLYAVRNLTSSVATADVENFDVSGTSLRTDSITLDPDETHPVDLRDVAGLSLDLDGYARGYIEISTARDPHSTPVPGGDFFQVDVADNFATGDKLVRRSTDLCNESSIRFLTFPVAGSGTRLSIWIANPQRAGLGDPASFTVQVFDEAGNPQGAPFGVFTASHELQLDTAAFAPGLFLGTPRFDSSASFGGVAYTEAQAGGRFAIGMTGRCHEAP